MPAYDDGSIDSILAYGKRLEGHTLREMMTAKQLSAYQGDRRSKGELGLAVEHYYDIAQNSDHEPDFPKVGLELKATGVRLDPEGLTVKERVTITTINYEDIQDEEFDGSALDLKSRRILFAYYLYEADQDALDAEILRVGIWERDAAVETFARRCHDYVKDRVADGEAHNLTSKHTAVVEPARKGSAGQMRSQPNGPDAKSRAFAFKRDFAHSLWLELAPEVAKADPDPEQTFRTYLRTRILEFVGYTVREIDALLHLDANMGAKHAHRLVADGIITQIRGVDFDDEDHEPVGGLEQLERLGITPKVVRLKDNGDPDQTPPFASVGFDRIVDMPFEGSRLYAETREVMFILWRAIGGVPDSPLLDVCYWRPTDGQTEAMREDYEAAQRAIINSDPDLLPTSQTANIFQVRTKGEDADHVAALPSGLEISRRGFYMNKDFARAVIEQGLADLGRAPYRH
jgi:DNA mismatch repair protein MutH